MRSLRTWERRDGSSPVPMRALALGELGEHRQRPLEDALHRRSTSSSASSRETAPVVVEGSVSAHGKRETRFQLVSRLRFLCPPRARCRFRFPRRCVKRGPQDCGSPASLAAECHASGRRHPTASGQSGPKRARRKPMAETVHSCRCRSCSSPATGHLEELLEAPSLLLEAGELVHLERESSKTS
jgi:hypothetical protein